MEELLNVHGVGEGKAKKYGKPFVELISNYVEENDIIRPDDLVVKSTGANSGLKLYIIQMFCISIHPSVCTPLTIIIQTPGKLLPVIWPDYEFIDKCPMSVV